MPPAVQLSRWGAMTESPHDITGDLSLLILWVIRWSLIECAAAGELPQRLVDEMMLLGDPLDPLRSCSAARPQSRLRLGLIAQPFCWALSLAVTDAASRRCGQTKNRFGNEQGSIALLETGAHISQDAEESVCAFAKSAVVCVESIAAAQPISSPPESVLRAAGLYGACEQCLGIIPCRHFSPTPYRPELCMCAHGASHHMAKNIHAPPGMPGNVQGGQPQPCGVAAQACDTLLYDGKMSLGSRTHFEYVPTVASSQQLASSLSEVLQSGKVFLSSIGSTGVCDLLGLRRTAGTIEGRLPPSRRVLLRALNRLHVTPSRYTMSQPRSSDIDEGGRSHQRQSFRKKTPVCNLTTGGRALCKHAVRDSEGWWGRAGGTEVEKNRSAEVLALKIMATATWINLHAFGGSGRDGVWEVREALGHGGRWSADGSTFRGFLEPHREDGHERGWRH